MIKDLYKKNAILISFLLLLSILFSCTKIKETSSDKHTNKNDTITLIFQNFPIIDSTARLKNVNSVHVKIPKLSWVDEKGSAQTLSLSAKTIYSSEENNYDTVKIIPSNDKAIIKHKFNLLESVEFMFQKGDSVFFYYDENNLPQVQLLNRPTKPADFNWLEMWRRKNLGENEYSAEAYYSFPFMKLLADVYVAPEEKKKIYYPPYRAELIDQHYFLDSLKTAGVVSADIHDYYQNSIKYKLLSLEVDVGELSNDSIKQIIKKRPNDSSMIHHYQSFLEKVVQRKFLDSVRLINTGNGFTKDYKTSFDLILESTWFDKQTKDELLFDQLILVANNFSLKDFKTYFKKFERHSMDSILISQLRNKYFLDFDELRSASGNLYLLRGDKTKLTMDSLLSIHKGKVIYLDFWASWCRPCIEALPSSKQLRKHYSSKDVVFIYLSTDKQFENWVKASNKEGLNSVDENYLVINSTTSDFLKQLQFREIPRYILIDKKGNIAHARAPGPNGDGIKDLLDAYILEN